jgi:cytoskeleton protein RodZ
MSENYPEAAQPVVSIPDVSLPGQRLREAREAARMSLDEVAHHLHLDVQIIKSLEEDNYEKLPSAIYISGYLRSYARLLKLPEKEIVSAYTKGQEINASLIPENINIMPGKKRNNTGLFKLILPIVLLVVVAAVVIWLSEESTVLGPVTNNTDTTVLITDKPEQQTLPAMTAPAEEVTLSAQTSTQEEVTSDAKEGALIPPSAQEIEEKIAEQEQAAPEQKPIVKSSTNNAQGDLRLVFHEDSWVEVTDSTGTRFAYRLEKAGAELMVDGQAPYKILLGKASGVDVYFKGEKFDHAAYHRDEIAYFRVGATE